MVFCRVYRRFMSSIEPKGKEVKELWQIVRGESKLEGSPPINPAKDHDRFVSPKYPPENF
jgi:hypothetical protein